MLAMAHEIAMVARRADGLLTRAAVLTVFDVSWIVPEVNDDNVEVVTKFLVSSCERVVDEGGTPRWRLIDVERARVFRQMPQTDLRDILRELPNRSSDGMQVVLTRFLDGTLPSVDQLEPGDLAYVKQLYLWFGPDASLPPADKIQIRLDRAALTAPLARLLPRGLVGRQDLLAELFAFADPRNEPVHDEFIVQGVGGVGKSTVLAQLVLDLMDRKALTVYANYDRGWLLDGGPWALLDEILRQVGAQRPELRDRTTSLRREGQQIGRRKSGYSDVASRGSQVTELVPVGLLRKLGKLVPKRHAFVLVIDTLEELVRRESSYAIEVSRFFKLLRDSVPNVRVIMAGRALPGAGFPNSRVWPLTGLDLRDAVHLLGLLTNAESDDLLSEIAEYVGGNPLSLHLAAEVLSRTGINPTTMLAVGESNLQGQLYARLLDHIPDSRVRAVAHPGLVVRRISPQIIRQVLAEPCGIAPLSASEADEVFRALRTEATLCEPSPDGDGALVHRQDVRALMLPAILREVPGTTREIHEAAVRYYAALVPDDGGIRTPADLVSRREELYHRLMLGEDRKTLDRRWVHEVGGDLGAVVDELPPQSHAYVAAKVAGLHLPPELRAEVNDHEWLQAVRPSVEARLERGQASEALELIRERRGTDGRSLLPDLEIEALEHLDHIDEALALAVSEAQRAAQRGLDLTLREMLSRQARIFERMQRWDEATKVLDGLLTLDRERRARTSRLDEEVRKRELVVLTSLLRIERHRGRGQEDATEALAIEAIQLAENTPQRVLVKAPSLLRDLAAEIGPRSSSILRLAVDTLGPGAVGLIKSDGGSPNEAAISPSEDDTWSDRFVTDSDWSQEYVPDRILVDLGTDGTVKVTPWLSGQPIAPSAVSRVTTDQPLAAEILESLRWYLEDYLRAPFGVYEDVGVHIESQLHRWGVQVFEFIFGSGPARDAYDTLRARGGDLELVLRSPSAEWLGFPWELMCEPGRSQPLVLEGVRMSRMLPGPLEPSFAVEASSRLRVLMVISRPEGPRDVEYRMVARPLLRRLEAVRGRVELVVLRPPTLSNLRDVLQEATAVGKPFQVVHFDGHGALLSRDGDQVGNKGAPAWANEVASLGVLVFETVAGSADFVEPNVVAAVLAEGQVPLVVLNACNSGAVGKKLEAAVGTRLLQTGEVASVVAMAYSVYAVAAAEFMAAFYERLFAGDTVSHAMASGRAQLTRQPLRPSAKGMLPLQDWVVPVLYQRREIQLPGLRTARPQNTPSLDALLDDLRRPLNGADILTDPLAPDGEFVGRDGLFSTLETALARRRIVILSGIGGTGKTEAAKAFGRWWRDTGGVSSPELVIWHSFEPGAASFGLDAVVDTIGLQVFGVDFGRLDSGARRHSVMALLTTQRVLLVWDNFEFAHSMPASHSATPPLDQDARHELSAFLDDIAQSPSAVIIISRNQEEWLGPSFQRITVGGLVDDEVHEFIDQVLAPYPDTRQKRQHRDFAELIEWLQGHPLSLRLILPLLDNQTPDNLLAALRGVKPDDELTALLAGEAKGEAEGRSRSLAASIAYSIQRLPSEDDESLVVASMFHGVVDVNVLASFSQKEGVPERFAARSREEWNRILSDGAKLGLLADFGVGIFGLHPALPAYLAKRWSETAGRAYVMERQRAEEALRDAYADLGIRLSQQLAFGDAREALAMIEIQRRTMCAIFAEALGAGAYEQARMIIQPIDDYWETKGLAVEAEGWVNRTREAVEQPLGNPPDLASSAGALWMFMVGSQANRDLAAGRRLDIAAATHRDIARALETLPVTHPRRALLRIAYHQLAMVEQSRGRLDVAEEWYERSLIISEELGDRRGLANIYHQLGVVAQLRGRLDVAQEWYEKCLSLREELGDQQGVAKAYHQLGMVEQDRGHVEPAQDWYRKALRIAEALADRPAMGRTYHQLGRVAQALGEQLNAQGWYQKSLAIAEELGNLPGMADSYHELGVVEQSLGRLAPALAWYEKALTIREELGDRAGMLRGYLQLGMVERDLGRLSEADAWYQKALTLTGEFGDRPAMAMSYVRYDLVEEAREQYSAARLERVAEVVRTRTEK
jgi:tetratricopeptide (TPR) repeat protein